MPEPVYKVAATSTPLFKLDDVTFSIGGRQLLEPLTLVLPASRVIGLIGHNGSGKSTLVKLLARQLRASLGTIHFAGRQLNEWSERRFARKVGYMAQQMPVTAGMLVKELVALGRYPWHGALGRFGQIDRDKVAEAMSLADVEGLGDRLIETLSGGECQRAWLAMLIAQDTECLLLDEPISALDIAHQIEVLALIRRLSEDRGLGVIVVLHDVNMASRFCDEIIALRAGRVIARGTPTNIITPTTLQNIYQIDMSVVPHPATGKPVAIAR